MKNIIAKHNYHKIPEHEREYGCECKNCGTIFTFTGDNVVYYGDDEIPMVWCNNCLCPTDLKDCIWLRNKKEVEQFTKLHKALNEES